MRRPVLIVVLSVVLVAAILIWRAMSSVDPVGLSNVTAQPVVDTPGEVHVGMIIQTADAPDVLLSVSSTAAVATQIVSPLDKQQLALPSRGAPSLSEDGTYIKLEGVEGDLGAGRLIPLTLVFARSGEVSVRARIGAAADPHAKHRAMAAMEEAVDDGPAPVMTMALEPAADGATLVRLEVENFTFAPGSDTPEHVPGHGHGHLYLDGVKLQRMYGHEALIGALPTGTYQVQVDLNTNLHVPYMGPDGPVRAVVELRVR